MPNYCTIRLIVIPRPMKTKISALIMGIIGATMFLAPLAHGESNAMDILNNQIYHSSLGFSVLFPPGWENYTVTGDTLDYGELGTASAVEIGLPDQLDMLTVSRHNIDQWNSLTGLNNTSIPLMLGVTDSSVIAYSVNEQYANEEIDWIIGHITIHEKSLSDIEGTENEEAIQYLLDTMVISGYPDGTFKPEQTINRAELMKIITEARAGAPDGELYQSCFPDVMDEWFAKYVCYAKAQNWVQGYPDGNFKPDQSINKAEALKMIVNSQGMSIPGSVNDALFDDVDNSAWYAPFVKAAFDRGLLEQTGGSYGIGDLITRAEVSENIYRALLVTGIDSQGSPAMMDEGLAAEEILATIEGYALFTSDSYNFSVEYPDNWFYEGLFSDPFSNVRTYEFGPGLDQDGPALVTLEVRSGQAPDGTIIEMNSKNLVLTEEAGQTNVYYTGDVSERLFRVFGASEYQDIMLQMASTIQDLPEEQKSGY